MTELTLFDSLPEFAAYTVPHEATIEERFQAHHEANPWIAKALADLAREALNRGERVGMKALFERLRWSYNRSTTGECLPLNNTFTSRYSRLLASTCPDLRDVFAMRELTAA